MKKIISIIACTAMLFSLSSCAFVRDLLVMNAFVVARDREFSYEDLSVTLTTDFMTMDFISEDYLFIWGDGDVTVMGTEALLEEDVIGAVSAADYAEIFADNLGITEEDAIGELDGIPTIRYDVFNDEPYTYLVCIYESSDGFWVVVFGSEAEVYEEHYEEICKYAKSVKIEK